MKRLLDTNTIIYLLGGRLAIPLETGEYCASVISEMELLSYPSLDAAEEEHICSFLGEILIIGLVEPVKKVAIQLRRQHGLKLPDAIVAASAMVLAAEMLTNDLELLQIPGLRARALALKAGT